MSVESLVNTEPNDTLVQRLGHKMLHTYYASFRLSQGSGSAQQEILRLAAYYYRSQYERETMVDAHNVATERVSKLVLPPGHPPQNRQSIRNQFTDYWKYFGEVIPGFKRTCSWRDPVMYEMFGSTVGLIAKQDASYLQPVQHEFLTDRPIPYAGRPVGETGRDPRQSFMRDYILQGVSIRDETLDRILGEARALVVSVKPGEACSSPALEDTYANHLPTIANLWEQHHPNQQFIDPAPYIGSRLLESVNRGTAR